MSKVSDKELMDSACRRYDCSELLTRLDSLSSEEAHMLAWALSRYASRCDEKGGSPEVAARLRELAQTYKDV
jgi:hypothetical protein